MKDKLKKAFFVAMLGTGAAFGAAGTYLAGNAAVQEFIVHKDEYDAAKQCVKQVRAGNTCSPEQYQWTALYAGQKQDYGMGLSWLFGGASFVRMSLPKVRNPRQKPQDKKPA